MVAHRASAGDGTARVLKNSPAAASASSIPSIRWRRITSWPHLPDKYALRSWPARSRAASKISSSVSRFALITPRVPLPGITLFPTRNGQSGQGDSTGARFRLDWKHESHPVADGGATKSLTRLSKASRQFPAWLAMTVGCAFVESACCIVVTLAFFRRTKKYIAVVSRDGSLLAHSAMPTPASE